MINKVKITGGTIDFFDILLAAFICFKVVGLIDWSWGKVFIPLYIGIAIQVLNVLVSEDDK